MCKNSKNLNAWYCFFWRGKPTAGETVNAEGRCRACQTAHDGTDNPPSWMENEDD